MTADVWIVSGVIRIFYVSIWQNINVVDIIFIFFFALKKKSKEIFIIYISRCVIFWHHNNKFGKHIDIDLVAFFICLFIFMPYLKINFKQFFCLLFLWFIDISVKGIDFMTYAFCCILSVGQLSDRIRQFKVQACLDC